MINELTYKIGKKINYCEKYEKIFMEHPKKNNSVYILNTSKVVEYITSLGYEAKYYKSEDFFWILIGKTNSGTEVVCKLTISDSKYIPTSNVNSIIEININGSKAGSSLSMWYKEMKNMHFREPAKFPFFKDEDELKIVLNKIFSIAEELKNLDYSDIKN